MLYDEAAVQFAAPFNERQRKATKGRENGSENGRRTQYNQRASVTSRAFDETVSHMKKPARDRVTRGLDLLAWRDEPGQHTTPGNLEAMAQADSRRYLVAVRRRRERVDRRDVRAEVTEVT